MYRQSKIAIDIQRNKRYGLQNNWERIYILSHWCLSSIFGTRNWWKDITTFFDSLCKATVDKTYDGFQNLFKGQQMDQ